MPESRAFSPTRTERQLRAPDGSLVTVPDGWECLPPGDAGFTRRVKALGDTWQVVEMRGRKKFSRGLWADAAIIAQARREVEGERARPEYARRKVADAKRREAAQGEYVEDFRGAVAAFLGFHESHREAQRLLAEVVTAHATPVGSGTVAQTKRIPVEERAEAAVVAWMRHQTTAYDHLKITRVKGERRRVRRELAAVSRRLLDGHRRPGPHDEGCLLCRALFGGHGRAAS
jgi:hypothetical protein